MRSLLRGLWRSTLAPLLILPALACGSRTESAPRVPLSQLPVGESASSPTRPLPPAELPPGARTALDSGNAQFRSGRYDEALASYRASVKQAPGHTAPEFGVYMAAHKLGDSALADSALRIVNAHTAGSPGWTDSAMQSAHGAKKLPGSHPPVVR